jgi:uncharacterized protein (DUF433 family)
MSGRNSIKPDVANGRPVVHRTRITVQTVLELLAAGASVEDGLEDCQNLTRADAQAWLKYQLKPWDFRLMVPCNELFDAGSRN